MRHWCSHVCYTGLLYQRHWGPLWNGQQVGKVSTARESFLNNPGYHCRSVSRWEKCQLPARAFSTTLGTTVDRSAGGKSVNNPRELSQQPGVPLWIGQQVGKVSSTHARFPDKPVNHSRPPSRWQTCQPPPSATSRTCVEPSARLSIRTDVML